VVPLGANVLGELVLPGSGKVLGNLSSRAMDYFGKITGWGDYFVRHNSLMAGAAPMQGAKFGSSSVRIRDTEWVKTVVTPTSAAGGAAFTLNSKYYINPSNAKLFPKLAVRAQQFQKWKLHGMVVYLDSICSKSVSTTTGNLSMPQVLMLTQYNLSEKEATNKSQVLNSFFGNSRAVNEDLIHPIECDPAQRAAEVMYLWPTDALPGVVRDAKLENAGYITLFTQGGQQTTAFDSYNMRIEYDIELLQPFVRTQMQVSDHWERTVATGTFAANATLQSTSTSYGDPQGPYEIAGNVITFDDSVFGNFELELYALYSGSVSTFETVPTLGGNATALSILYGDTASSFSTSGYSGAQHHYKLAFKVVGGGTVTFATPNATTYTSGDYFLQSLEHLSN